MSFKRDNGEQMDRDYYVTGNTIRSDQQPSSKVRKTAGGNLARCTPETGTTFLKASVHFTADGRRPSALKRSGSSPSLQRKSVSFSIPDATSSANDDDDFLPNDTDEVTPTIEAIANAQKMTPSLNPRISFSPTSQNIVQPVILPIHPPRITETKEPLKDRLPTINREQLDADTESLEADTTPTFKSLRNKLRGMAPVRVRKTEPVSNPLRICLHCQVSLATHLELKNIIDHSIHYFKDAKVTCLQFDPLAVWSGDPLAQSRWIISLSDTDACNYLTRTGLTIHGEHFRVDSFDDVLRKEFEVYKIKQNILHGGKGTSFMVS